jgi:ubiquinone/menaquinone biosynthesis C-methylase UbiE
MGLACGVDITKDMADKARENLADAGVQNFEIKHTDSGLIPYPDNFFDVVISNGVINLAPDKLKCFREIYRVLKPSGKIQFADIILETSLPSELAGSLEAWSQ